MRRTNPLFFLVGIVVIFVGLLVLRAAVKNMGEGSCLTGCCMWELGESIMDLGCGLVGCAGMAAITLFGMISLGGWLHR